MDELPRGVINHPNDNTVRRTIWEWNQMTNVRVKDPDGFERGADLVHRLFTIEEYLQGRRRSTLEFNPAWNKEAQF